MRTLLGVLLVGCVVVLLLLSGQLGFRVRSSADDEDDALCACASWRCLRDGFERRDARLSASAASTAGAAGAATTLAVRADGGAPPPGGYRVPHFYLGGGQKCGTTSLHVFLARHPRVLAPSPKEPMYFNLPPSVRRLAAARYLRRTLHLPALCARASGAAAPGGAAAERFGRATYDASANYLQGGNATALALASAAPWLRHVLVLREPVARAVSWLRHMWLKYPTLPNCLHRHALDHCASSRWFVRGRGYLGGSQYARFVRAWLRAFPREQFHFVRFEDLVGAPRATLDAVTRFLALPPFEESAFGAAGALANANPRSPSAGHNMSLGTYRALVDACRGGAKELRALTGVDFRWEPIWERELARCARRDGACAIGAPHDDAHSPAPPAPADRGEGAPPRPAPPRD